MPYAVTSKGQVTIPKNIRDHLNIHANDRVEFVRDGNRVLLVPVRTLKDLRGVVPSKGKGEFAAERNRAKAAVTRRVREEMERKPSLSTRTSSCGTLPTMIPKRRIR